MHGTRLVSRTLLPAIFAVGVAAGGADLARAAPQLLGLASTGGPVPMTCTDGTCTAELSALCLQETRPVPMRGTAYRIAAKSKVMLVFERADGTRKRVAAARLLRYAAWRGHTVVKARLEMAALAPRGAVRVYVDVPRLAVLAPVPVPGDPAPITREDLARAGGVLRDTASELADGDSGRALAGRVMSRMINRLPQGDGTDPAWRRKLWQQEISQARRQGGNAARSRQGLALARYWQRICRGYARRPGQFRRCLMQGHDTMLGKINVDYWKIVGAGG